MRKLVSALAIALLAGTTAFAVTAEPVKAAAVQTKVVIVVGATHETTSSYRSTADSLATTFAMYTSNVTKVYSPNATWSAVRTAARGANILVYLGHGSGFPNPYSGVLYPQWNDGMGLNATAGHGDSNVQYYGEDYMAQLALAPNALVMLNHLCYASGNSEEGKAWPTLAVAKLRVDNFAAGFIRGGAKAVIAEGHGSLGGYVDRVFTSHGTIDQAWKSGHAATLNTWASPRSIGYTDQMEDSYYRSMVSITSTLTDDIISGQIPPFVSKSGTYFPLPPTRVIDTRGNGIGPTGALKAIGVYTFQVAGTGGVPSNAIAITGNLTVTGATGAGYVSVGPQIWGWPDFSTLNFPAKDDRANGVTVPLSDLGQLQAYYGASSGKTVQLILDVTGYFLAGTSGKGYVAFGPKRILDTRPGADHVGLDGKFVAGVSRQIQVAGVGGLPAAGSITAVVGNITVASPTAKGYVFLSPNPTTSPGSSTINFPAGDVRANNVVVPINPDGTLSAIYSSATGGATTDLILDISGYFATSGGAQYHTLNPARIMDSRINLGVSGAFAAATAKTLQVTGAGGVPSGAIAITSNLTMTGQQSIGFGAVGPTVAPDTKFSNINSPINDTRANGVTVPLSGGGSVQIIYGAAAGNAAHFILDVTGYFLP
jgi:hypothetical protein